MDDLLTCRCGMAFERVRELSREPDAHCFECGRPYTHTPSTMAALSPALPRTIRGWERAWWHRLSRVKSEPAPDLSEVPERLFEVHAPTFDQLDPVEIPEFMRIPHNGKVR